MTTPLDIRQFTNEELAQESLRRMNDTGDIFKDVEVPVEEKIFRIKNLAGNIVMGDTPYAAMQSYMGVKELTAPGESNPTIEKMYDDVLGYPANYKDDTAWCMGSAMHCAKLMGYKFVPRLDARSAWNKSDDVGFRVALIDANYGDYVVLARNDSNWRGHIMFYEGHKIINHKEVSITGLGGNQSNMVKTSTYIVGPNQTYRLLGLVRPEKAS